MNIKEYIASGILELYLLGALSPEESAEVTTMVSKHSELKEVLETLEKDLMNVAEINVPELLNNNILEHALLRIEAKTNALHEKNEAPKVIPITPNVDSNTAGNNSFFKLSAIAAAVLLLISLGLNYSLYQENINTQNQLADFNFKVEKLIQENEANTLHASELSAQLQILADASTSKVTLRGIEGKESFLATVFWNNETKQTFVSVNDLPEAPKGMQYQLWALFDGQPIDAGVFNAENKSGIQIAKNIESAQTFAVTLEEEGGKPTPNLEQLYVIGNV